MIVTSVVPEIKDTILELRAQGKSDDEILQVLLDPENIDLFFSEAEIEADTTFSVADHMDTINEAFRQLGKEEQALFSLKGARTLKTSTKLAIAGTAILSAGLLARWLGRREPTSFLMPRRF